MREYRRSRVPLLNPRSPRGGKPATAPSGGRGSRGHVYIYIYIYTHIYIYIYMYVYIV